jgi:two-component system sensor histidine kinase UhpB
MDLRWRLFGYVLGFALALSVAAVAWVGLALQQDVAEEMEASTRLADVILAVGSAPEHRAAELRSCWQVVSCDTLRCPWSAPIWSRGDGLRQRACWRPLPIICSTGGDPRAPHSAGDDVLVIRADPRAEIHEVLRDGMRNMVTLVVFCLGMAVVAWVAAHRALKPVRLLEQGWPGSDAGRSRFACRPSS